MQVLNQTDKLRQSLETFSLSAAVQFLAEHTAQYKIDVAMLLKLEENRRTYQNMIHVCSVCRQLHQEKQKQNMAEKRLRVEKCVWIRLQ